MLDRLFIISFFSFILFIPHSNGQEVVLSVEEREIMTRDVMAAYPDQFQTVKITTMTRIDEHYLRLEYVNLNSRWEAVLQIDETQPTLVETGQILLREDWPGFIIDALKSKEYNLQQIDKILKVSTPYGEQGYRADVQPEKQDSDTLIRHYFDRQGMFKKPIY